MLYVTGKAASKPDVDRIVRAAKAIHESLPAHEREMVSCPILGTQPAERFRAVLDADTVVLMQDWATDLQACRDAQLAVWLGKPLRQYDPLSAVREDGGGSLLRVVSAESVQTVLDQGLQRSMLEEGA